MRSASESSCSHVVLSSFLLFAVSQPLLAAELVNKTRKGVAIHGYDVVSYHLDQTATRGSKAHAFDWQGATWYFSKQAHRDLFAESPKKYAPQYGGYCAFAVSKGSLAKVDPQAWTLHEDKLFLNYSLGVRETWRQDIPGYVARADANWPALMKGL